MSSIFFFTANNIIIQVFKFSIKWHSKSLMHSELNTGYTEISVNSLHYIQVLLYSSFAQNNILLNVLEETQDSSAGKCNYTQGVKE